MHTAARVTTSTRLTPPERARVDALARLEGMGVSELIRRLVMPAVAERLKKITSPEEVDLRVDCPKCGRTNTLRIDPRLVAAGRSLHPDETLIVAACETPSCGRALPVTAGTALRSEAR